MPYGKLMDQHNVYMCMYACICESGKWGTSRINKKLHTFTLYFIVWKVNQNWQAKKIWIQQESDFHTLMDLYVGDWFLQQGGVRTLIWPCMFPPPVLSD